jgi:hypothetical protein
MIASVDPTIRAAGLQPLWPATSTLVDRFAARAAVSPHENNDDRQLAHSLSNCPARMQLHIASVPWHRKKQLSFNQSGFGMPHA